MKVLNEFKTEVRTELEGQGTIRLLFSFSGQCQEEALSTGKARGTPGPCHHSQSPKDVSVNSNENCFPCTASTFKPRIDSHHSGTWDSPMGKPRGKASWESLERKPQIP